MIRMMLSGPVATTHAPRRLAGVAIVVLIALLCARSAAAADATSFDSDSTANKPAQITRTKTKPPTARCLARVSMRLSVQLAGRASEAAG